MSTLSLVAAQDAFTRTISAVEDAVKFAFHSRLRPHEYEETMAEAMAAAWSAWHGLINRGKDPVTIGVHGIATNAIRNVRQGRRVSNNSSCGRGAMDVFNRKAQAKCGFKLVSLDAGDDDAEDSTRGSWREWLAEDNKVTPAAEACFRLDFEMWLGGLTPRKRRIAELLAEGHEGVDVARRAGVSPGRVSQVRDELEAGWAKFQHEIDGTYRERSNG